MASVTARQLINSQTTCFKSNINLPSVYPSDSEAVSYKSSAFYDNDTYRSRYRKLSFVLTSQRNVTVAVKASSGEENVTSVDDEGVSLGTMKLPLDIDVSRFETLLFQWANSLCQGAMLPLPMPLKVDKIEGGVRLGFVEIDDGKSQVLVYINCVVIPGSSNSDPPIFRATRNGDRKNKAPPGEPRIMKSLLGALQKSVELAS